MGCAATHWNCWHIPDISGAVLAAIWPEIGGLDPIIAEQLEIDSRYAGYIKRQDADILAFRRDEALTLPAELDYDTVGSLSTEVRAKLKAARPATLAARLDLRCHARGLDRPSSPCAAARAPR